MHSPAARALLQPCALLHHPRDTLKDLTLAGHVITITYSMKSGSSVALVQPMLCRSFRHKSVSLFCIIIILCPHLSINGLGLRSGFFTFQCRLQGVCILSREQLQLVPVHLQEALLLDANCQLLYPVHS